MERRNLDEPLSRLLGPAGPEIGCDECFEELDRYVDLEVAARMPTQRCSASRAPRRVPGLPRGVREPARARQSNAKRVTERGKSRPHAYAARGRNRYHPSSSDPGGSGRYSYFAA